MIWALLVAVGVPLWLCALGIFAILWRNRQLRRRPGNIPVRVRPAGNKRWKPGHAVWVSDVLAFRGSPAAWNEQFLQIASATSQRADDETAKHLHRIGDQPVVATFDVCPYGVLEVAAREEHIAELLGPFGVRAPGPRAPAAPQPATL